jgi:hypothetical protein
MLTVSARARSLTATKAPGLGLAGFVAWVAAASVFSAVGGSAAFPVVGYVYVNDNAAGANTIAGFGRSFDGTLTPLSGSPSAAGGVNGFSETAIGTHSGGRPTMI